MHTLYEKEFPCYNEHVSRKVERSGVKWQKKRNEKILRKDLNIQKS